MGRKPKDVPIKDHREMCRMHNEQGSGPHVIARHFNWKYHPSHITRLLAKCHPLITPAAGRDAVAKTIAPLPDTSMVHVHTDGKPDAVQAIKSQSTLPSVKQNIFGSGQLGQSQSHTNLTSYTFPAPEPIDENDGSDDDNYENDGYLSSYDGASAPPTQASLTSGLVEPFRVFTNVVNGTINSGIIRMMSQFGENLSNRLFPNLYPTQTTTNDGNRLSENEKEVIRKVEDFLKRREEEKKSHAHDGTKPAADVEELTHSCPCSPEPDESDSSVNSNEAIQVMSLGTESNNIQHDITDPHQLLQTSENENTPPQESSAPGILSAGRNSSVTDDSKIKGKEVGVENSSTPPITVDKVSPPSITETRQPAIVDDATRSESQLARSQSAEVHIEQKTPVPQVDTSPNVNDQEVVGAHEIEASNGHESSGQSADTIGIPGSINTPGKCQLNISAPVVDQNYEKPVTPSKPAYVKVNDSIVPLTYPSEGENHFVPVKSGEIAAQAESGTQNNSESSGWIFLAIAVAGAAAVIGYDLYRKYRSGQLKPEEPPHPSEKDGNARVNKPDGVALF